MTTQSVAQSVENLPVWNEDGDPVSSISSIGVPLDGCPKLSENNYIYLKGNGFFRQYRGKTDNKLYSGFVASVSPINSGIRTQFRTKLDVYMKLQDQVDNLLKIYGYFIADKKEPNEGDSKITKEIIVLTEPNAVTLSEFMSNNELTKAMYLDMASTISLTLNTLYKQNQLRLSYIAPQDIIVVDNNGKKGFKFFGIQNDGSMENVPSALTEWTSPELFLKIGILNRDGIDASRSLNYSWGLVLLYAGNKQIRPTSQRTLKTKETPKEAALQQEHLLIGALINVVSGNYRLHSSHDAFHEKNALFLEKLKASLVFEQEKRAGIEVWQLNDVEAVKSDHTKPTEQPKSSNAISHPSRNQAPSAKIENKQMLTLQTNQIELVGQGTDEVAIKVESKILATEERKSNEVELGKANQGQLWVGNTGNKTGVKPKPAGRSRRSYFPKVEIKKFDPDEMAPFSWLVGIFCGMIFIGLITIILLVRG